MKFVFDKITKGPFWTQKRFKEPIWHFILTEWVHVLGSLQYHVIRQNEYFMEKFHSEPNWQNFQSWNGYGSRTTLNFAKSLLSDLDKPLT